MKNYKAKENENTTIDPFLVVMNKENYGYRRLYGRGVTNTLIKKVEGPSTSYMITEGLMESFKANVDVEKNQLLEMRKEIEDDHERKKAELEAMRADIDNQRQNLEAMMQKTVKDEIDEGEETLEPIIFEDVIDDEDQSEEDGDAMETDVEDNEEFHEAVSNVSDDDIVGSDGMVDYFLDEEQWGLVTWVQDSIKEGNLKKIIDSDIRGEISPKCLKEYFKLVEWCLHNSPKHRPTMAEILCWVEENTLAPSKQGVGMAVAVKRLHIESTQGTAEWQVR
ncbi:hypothetical protein E3N88_22920 [Mikania micrantha]|uniref:Serine-threonine/tyrosine-protein kinase catalytic domain-containing protein n=1 Tax=Mikania micrantha TaxID=192012 RepID=A0A5N6NCW1_9ASTR|nr:hypothetical protein E3N88_22920 [Mikania micrantha]